ncbi:acetoin dehydrogenase dihydrolipoyllysine-residue acetyltransferase subunit [Mesorhizobium sp. NZP2234]|uniref:acetoin dehydrogenase dihydrolipoyllysine-residue acetyltransferase subunit n=1 Tax=Mesorhizobium sp. NZP2234 TaxID=2483402 RepID=UPI001552A9F6|nr:acetoin dehydrogenase dihydrolipoyllysine-residue acetyltransferase subunit [Mesorhizobium sp. NZP2234]
MTDITVVGAGGEYMESVVVVEWHKKPGDAVTAGELVVTVETAKAATEIEAPASGILAQIKAEVGQEIELGGVLGVIAEAGAIQSPGAEPAESLVERPTLAAKEVAKTGSRRPSVNRVLASPLARRVAAQKSIDLSELTASSVSGRIKLRDIEAYETTARGIGRPAATVAPARPSSGAIHVTRRGKPGGIPILLVHGFGSDSLSWQPLVAALGNSASIILVDLPGHGKSPPPEGKPSIHGLAEVLASALRELGIEGVHLVGHSLGGAVCLALAESGALEIQSLTLLAPAGLGPEIDGAFVDGYNRATRPESLKPWLLRLFADASIVTPGFVAATLQARGDVARQRQIELAAAFFPDGTQASELRGVLKRLTQPQKIIWGELDRIIPMRHALHAGAAAAVHFMPGVGHMPHVEEPSTVARLILQNVSCAT